MFKPGRRTLAGLTAVAAIAAGIGTGAASPQVASAASSCNNWRMPSSFAIEQTNGWTIWTSRHTSAYRWTVYGSADPQQIQAMVGKLKLTQFDTSGVNPQVRFTITWSNNSAGVYTGTIDQDGFLVGSTADKFHPRSKANFNLTDSVDCLG